MTEIEKLATQLADFAITEIDGVADIRYTKKENNELNSFIIILENGKRYALKVENCV